VADDSQGGSVLNEADVTRVRAILEAMRRNRLAELEIRIGKDRVAVRDPAATSPVPVSGGVLEAGCVVTTTVPIGSPIETPITGTYYASSRPGAEPLVKVGDPVTEGTVIGLVEAMKVFNEIISDKSGSVTEVLVRSGDSVTEGQPLIMVDTGREHESGPATAASER
jgi:acetyl-CoA carboxylase biotin carboxyl carrier protein